MQTVSFFISKEMQVLRYQVRFKNGPNYMQVEAQTQCMGLKAKLRRKALHLCPICGLFCNSHQFQCLKLLTYILPLFQIVSRSSLSRYIDYIASTMYLEKTADLQFGTEGVDRN